MIIVNVLKWLMTSQSYITAVLLLLYAFSLLFIILRGDNK